MDDVKQGKFCLTNTFHEHMEKEHGLAESQLAASFSCQFCNKSVQFGAKLLKRRGKHQLKSHLEKACSGFSEGVQGRVGKDFNADWNKIFQFNEIRVI